MFGMFTSTALYTCTQQLPVSMYIIIAEFELRHTLELSIHWQVCVNSWRQQKRQFQGFVISPEDYAVLRIHSHPNVSCSCPGHHLCCCCGHHKKWQRYVSSHSGQIPVLLRRWKRSKSKAVRCFILWTSNSRQSAKDKLWWLQISVSLTILGT